MDYFSNGAPYGMYENASTQDNIAVALMSGGAKARHLLEHGTEKEKELARNYLEAEKKMFAFYNFVDTP